MHTRKINGDSITVEINSCRFNDGSIYTCIIRFNCCLESFDCSLTTIISYLLFIVDGSQVRRDERSEHARNDAAGSQHERHQHCVWIQHQQLRRRVGRDDERGARRLGKRTEQIGTHTSDIADVITDVIGDHCWITRIIFLESNILTKEDDYVSFVQGLPECLVRLCRPNQHQHRQPLCRYHHRHDQTMRPTNHPIRKLILVFIFIFKKK